MFLAWGALYREFVEVFVNSLFYNFVTDSPLALFLCLCITLPGRFLLGSLLRLGCAECFEIDSWTDVNMV